MLNRVTLVGRITQDPQIRTSTTDKKFVAFTLAVNNSFNRNNADNNTNNNTNFISCFAWERNAENLVTYIKKGTLLAVDGSLAVTRKNGINNMFVNARTISFLEKRQSGTDIINNNVETSFNVNEIKANNNKSTSSSEPSPDDPSILFDDEDILWE